MQTFYILHAIDFDGTLTDNRHRKYLRADDPEAYIRARGLDAPSKLLTEMGVQIDRAVEDTASQFLGLPADQTFSHARTILTDRPFCAAQETADFFRKYANGVDTTEATMSFRTTERPSADEKLSRLLGFANPVQAAHLEKGYKVAGYDLLHVVDDDLKFVTLVEQAAWHGRFHLPVFLEIINELPSGYSTSSAWFPCSYKPDPFWVTNASR